MKKIPFNIPPYTDDEDKYIIDSINSHKICGDNNYTYKCEKLLEEKFGSSKVYLTTSGTSALEMACMLSNIEKGDEVIMPSYTFSSTANAVTIFGGIPVFVDIRPDTMNINEELIEAAITSKTKAIIAVHYAGIGCNMIKICDIAKKYGLIVIEDAAQAVNSMYNNKYLGTCGDIGCFSFHETKNYSMGEGGAILINNEKYKERAAIIREKGTNRTAFKNGQVDKYTWVDKGSSYLPSDILAAYLYPQLLIMDEIKKDRVKSFSVYYDNFKDLQEKGIIDLPHIPIDCVQNGHMFYIKCKDLDERKKLQVYLRENDIESAFHYIPLHSAPYGLCACRFNGDDLYTTKESNRLLRLPMFYRIDEHDIVCVCNTVKEFYK